MKKKGKNAKLYLIGMIIGGMTLGLTTVIADTIINSTNVSYKTTTVKAALDDLYGLTADDVWQKIYPVGAVYISVNSTSPATLFGGTWQAFGTGRTLVGIDTSDDDFKTVEKTGGSKTKTIAVRNLPAHAHTYTPSGTIGNTGGGKSHTHGVTNTSSSRTTVGGGSHTDTNTVFTLYTTIPANYSDAYTINAGGTTRWWRNTSSNTSIANHTHSYTDYYANTTSQGTTLTVDQMPSHNHTFTGTASSTTACTDCSGTALNTQDPYITVYMWKRTA